MAINLHSKYAKQIQTKFVKESIVTGLLSNEYSWAGVKTVKISTPLTVPMVDYTRTGANRYGVPTEMQDIVQELTLTQDKSFALTIDKGNNADQNDIKAAGKMLSLQIREQAVPAMDKYVLQTLANKAGNIVAGAALTKSTVLDAIDAGITVLDDAEVPDSDRVIFVSADVYQLIKKTGVDLYNEALVEKAFSKGQVGWYNGARLVKVPKGRLPIGLQFMIAYRNSATAPVKLNDTRLHTDPPGISGHLLEGRQYYDCFVFGVKAAGIYAYVDSAKTSVTAAPTITTAGVITAAQGAVIMYTIDGTDPRYSSTAKVYSSAVGEAGDTIKAYAYAAGAYPSAVAEEVVAAAGNA